PCGRGSGRAVTSIENSGYIGRLQSSFTYQYECTYQISYHVVQKTIAAYLINKFYSFSSPFRAKDLSHIAEFCSIPLRVHCGKRREIMFTQNQSRRFFHRVLIKRIWIMPHISGQERRTNPASINPISVLLYLSRLLGRETIP